MGGGGGLAGAAPRGYNSASGGIPGVTSPITSITGNLGGIGGIINSITGQQSTSLRDQYPDEYFSTLGTVLGNTKRRAAGDISDLLPELQQSSAENAVYGGMSGSQAENTKLLRDLGLTRYGVENEAINSLGKIQGEIPTVHPFDPTGIIAAQLAAQERADMFAAAPVPEDAYNRALGAAGGGGGGGTGGKSYNTGGAGHPGTVDAALRGSPAPIIARGSAQNPMGSSGSYAPWGSFPNAIPGSQDDFEFSSLWDTPDEGNDFGGSLGYGGGQPWQGLNTDIFGGGGGGGYGGGTVDDWLTTNYDPSYSDYYDEGY